MRPARVSHDGQRFLINCDMSEAPLAPITVVTNWQPDVTEETL